MKKSTLITTIAMIVVVVVALSTATYAWFASSTATTVSGTMSTAVKSGWILYGGSASTTSAGVATVTYSSSAPTLHFLNELYSPMAALNPTLSVDGLTGTYTQTKFYKATQTGIGMVETANASIPGYTHQEVANGPEIDNLNYLRIINNTTETQTSSDHLELEITVYVTDAASTALIAGKRFCTYIATSNNEHFNTRYYHGTVAEGSAPDPEDSSQSITTYTANRTELVGKSGVTYSTVGAQNKTVELESALATDGYTIVGDTAVTLDDGTVLPTGAAYYTITIDLGAVAKSGALSMVFYAWFDGWALDNTAAGGAVGVLYSFGTLASA